jgi:hypothetical protein
VSVLVFASCTADDTWRRGTALIELSGDGVDDSLDFGELS